MAKNTRSPEPTASKVDEPPPKVDEPSTPKLDWVAVPGALEARVGGELYASVHHEVGGMHSILFAGDPDWVHVPDSKNHIVAKTKIVERFVKER